MSYILFKTCLSKLGVHKTHPESFLKPRLLGLTLLEFPIGLRCGPRICIFDKFPSDADAAGWSGDPIVKTTGLEA